MLRLWTGRTQTGKSHRIFHEMALLKEKHPGAMGLLLVPEQYSLEAERQLIDLTGGQGIMHLEVTNFGRLVHRVMGFVEGGNQTVIDDLGKVMLLKKSLIALEEDLNFYQQASKKYGFNDKLMTFLKEAKRNMLSPEDIAKAAQSLEKKGLLSQKLREISEIYKMYESLKSDEFYDEEDEINKAIEGIEMSGVFKGAHIWIDGFFGFTRQEYALIMALTKVAGSVTVCLTLDPMELERNDSLFYPSNTVYHRLRSLANEAGIQVKDRWFKDDYCHAVTKGIEASIFQYPVQMTQAPEGIQIFGSTTRFGEIEYVASEIIRLTRDASYRFEDIAVVANGIDEYQIHIDRIFKRYGISYFLDGNRKLLKEPLMQFVSVLLEGLAVGLSTKRLMTLLKSGMMTVDESLLFEVENYAYEFDIKPKQWELPLSYGEEQYHLEAINDFREKYIYPFFELKSSLKKDQTVSDWLKQLYSFFTEIGLAERINERVAAFTLTNDGEMASMTSQSWNKLLHLLDQLMEVVGEDVMDMKSFVMLFQAGIEAQKVGIIPPTKDRVFVGELGRVRSSNPKALFVIGVNDGILPQNKASSQLLTDDELSFLKEEGLHVMSDIDALTREEELYIYLALTKPSEALCLSYASMNDEGKAQRPSSLLEHLTQRLENLQHKNDISLRLKMKTEDIPYTISNVSASFEHLVNALRDACDGHQIDERWWDVYAYYQSLEDYKEPLGKVLNSLFYEYQVEKLPKDLVDQLFGSPFITNISRLESYARCPFKHFVDYGLKPVKRKRREVQFPDMGNLFHNTVEKYGVHLNKQKKNWRDMDMVAISKVVDQIIEEEVATYQEGVFFHTPRTKYLIEKIRRVSKRAIWTLTKQIKQGEFEPSAYEVAFDGRFPNSLPPIVIELAGGEKVQVKGRIDRVDLLKRGQEAYGLVMDYKSGFSSFDLSEVYQGLQLQLMTYLKTIIDNPDYFRVDKMYPAGVFYFKIDDPMMTVESLDLSGVEDAIFKTLKLDGIVVDDSEIVEKLDEEYTDPSGSKVLPLKVKKDLSFNKASKVIDEPLLMMLLDVVEERMKDTSAKILKGDINVSPLDKNGLVCDYCSYQAVCQIGLAEDKSCVRYYKKMSNDDVKEALLGGKGHAEMDE